MKFSRHAKNQMRLYELAPNDVTRIIAAPEFVGSDFKGRRRYIGTIGGRRYRVLVALDVADFIVTVHEWRK